MDETVTFIREGRREIERARKRLAEIELFLRESPPFDYVLETDYLAKSRGTYARPNQESLDHVRDLVGDISLNLVTALNRIYFGILSPTGAGQTATRDPVSIRKGRWRYPGSIEDQESPIWW